MTQFNHISVIGLGYVGLPTAVAFAQSGIKVSGVDINSHIINMVNRGQIHFVEPELEIALKTCIKQNTFFARTTPEASDAFLIAVPTPVDHKTHEVDLSYIQSAIQSLAPVLQKGNIIILESTVPVGTTALLADWLATSRPDLTFPQQLGEYSDIRIAYCPERVLPGKIMHELMENDRIIGGMTQACSEQAVRLYQYFVKGKCLITNSRTAEMCKLTENAFRDVNIAFANEISMICDKLNINVWELISLANHHPRVNILQPGCGVGGHCIAVDPWFIVNKSPELAKLIKTARDVNDSKPNWVIDKVNEAVVTILKGQPTKSIHDLRIACLGLTFKANIDDLRESPALYITEKLAHDYPNQVLVVEPHIQVLPNNLLSQGVILTDLKCAIEQVDILVILVDHDLFKSLNYNEINETVLIDTKGIFH
ncbi:MULTISPECIES: UDP-N-acetyl-D-mannosamine dehydrogenase [Glaesserella]|uniref:UDP-N-acetyl-D-mannosamine dehydrogenase n=1 Tax=Glaesserella australis TaxID=2094024 RepID=A0A328C131_9PAST|nr:MULTISPECIES: UDP-N-acetyl-D-mannosamine dehydrogenase [Glaesserella]AUI65430.1 UDP-N-acetyl-D-mannosamine dehydrogenase [Glaesserella sp. 15-184]RAL19625.1 UDP-N-acetyl-D-mannosamine dehydrogenase [Glaesserella australis]